ncbi:DNA-binding response regulator, OmpR family, contains REC and winged-helix (wHTH) domain [Mesonia phycicola]|uniref:DNA-binding response regulator, OmpR family, contains REC and winged-helix (WHTH) domain n=1 Tax=Mesonia phycicola TaxID=579105 RepID=A0A1M6A4Z7_9FLAO|nr:response regulator transcription factor [Mesonia phycicola]SHI31465.1 DNA-binding response regulator, OmpR family, contains REC and winged-helix (wHTH) domain [Mesonia phycicola]
MKILIIEDEEQMLQNMKQTLEKEDYLVETATDYDSAFSKIGVYDYDCILLDISLPGKNGLEILRELKSRGITDGVIIVSAKNSLEDKIEGLNLGADDYLPKPFHMAELNARIKAIFRRRKLKGSNQLKIGNLSIKIDSQAVSVADKELTLNRKEFDILFYLASNKDRLVNKSSLAEHVWGDHIDQADSFDFIYSQIKNLRKKLSTNNAEVELKSIYGIGYKLTAS